MIDTLFSIAVLIFSVVVHEVAHGYVAYRLGDNTAFYAKRLTLNPIRHLDPFGSVLLPLVLSLSGSGFVFGWAKPVPYNPDNIHNGRKGEIMIALAGIIANLSIAVVFSFILRLIVSSGFVNEGLMFILPVIVIINLLLAVFNLVPIPPLDGSKVLFSLLGDKYRNIGYEMERYSIIFIVIFVVFFWKYVSPLVSYLFSLLTGINI